MWLSISRWWVRAPHLAQRLFKTNKIKGPGLEWLQAQRSSFRSSWSKAKNKKNKKNKTCLDWITIIKIWKMNQTTKMCNRASVPRLLKKSWINLSFNLEALLSKFSYTDLDKKLEFKNDLTDDKEFDIPQGDTLPTLASILKWMMKRSLLFLRILHR